jgi:hypothetical protein
MGHSSLGSDGLLLLVIASALLLTLFVVAAIRAPAEASRPDPGPAAPPEPAQPAPPLPRRRVISPAADAMTQNTGADYPPRHAAPGQAASGQAASGQAVSGGPPWEPAPKPPGVDRDDAW